MNRDNKGFIARAKGKLYGDRGVTIVFALTIFLITCLMSIVIVSAAVNNANRMERQRDDQQMSLAVSSATSYVRFLLDGCTLEVTGGGENSFAGDGKLSALDDAFKSEFIAFVNGGPTATLTWHIGSSLSGEGTAPDVNSSVAVDLKFEKKSRGSSTDYIVNIVKPKDKSDTDSRQYKVAIVYRCKVSKTTKTKTVTDIDGKVIKEKVEVTKYSWQYYDMER